MKQYSIAHPEWLDIQVGCHVSHGYDQEWFQDAWKKLAGCGPTTATQMMSYIGLRDGWIEQDTAHDQSQALARMETVWNYVKPRYGGGLYKTSWLEQGLEKFITDRGLAYDVHMINVSPFPTARIDVAEAGQFIINGLSQDVPVAFLNRHKGKERVLYTWHWVPIIGLSVDSDDWQCTILDEGQIRTFSLSNWMKDTILGGGFAYVSK